MTELAAGTIVDGASALDPTELAAHLAALPGWALAADGRAISREWRFKTFRRAAQLANLAAWQAEAANHHPDIAFGWGYCRVTWTTHDAGGLTEADFAAAAGFDRLLA